MPILRFVNPTFFYFLFSYFLYIMVYHRRRRSSSSTSKQIKYRKPTAKTQQKQLLSLEKRVRMNSKHIREERYLAQHSLKIPTDTLGVVPGQGPYNSWAFSLPQFWQQVFGNPGDVLGGRYTGQKVRIEYNIHPGKNQSNTDITIFIVRPKNTKCAFDLGLATGSNFDPSPTTPNPMTPGTHYSNQDGVSIMNPKLFHIDYVAKHTVLPQLVQVQPSPPGTTPINHINQIKPIRRVIHMKNPIKINNRQQDAMVTDTVALRPNQRIFLVAFSDAPAPTTGPSPGPTIEMLVHFTGHTSK